MNNIQFKILTVLLVFFSVTSISAQEKVNQYDENGRRTGEWKKYYENNRIRYQGQFVADKEVDVFKFYSMVSSEHPIIIKTFLNENDMAKVEFFTEEGILESKGEMKKDLRIGKWLFYHKGGKTLISEENYKEGLLHGVSKTYYKTGKTTEILFYNNGKLNGNIKRFSDEGVLLDDLNYIEGKLNGLATYYDTYGKVRETGQYKDDEKIGNWDYFENGEKVNQKSVKQQ